MAWTPFAFLCLHFLLQQSFKSQPRNLLLQCNIFILENIWLDEKKNCTRPWVQDESSKFFVRFPSRETGIKFLESSHKNSISNMRPFKTYPHTKVNIPTSHTWQAQPRTKVCSNRHTHSLEALGLILCSEITRFSIFAYCFPFTVRRITAQTVLALEWTEHTVL